MSDVLHMQNEDPDTADEEKASYVSVGFCRNSFKSFAFCQLGPV